MGTKQADGKESLNVLWPCVERGIHSVVEDCAKFVAHPLFNKFAALDGAVLGYECVHRMVVDVFKCVFRSNSLDEGGEQVLKLGGSFGSGEWLPDLKVDGIGIRMGIGTRWDGIGTHD